MGIILEVKDLKTQFKTESGVVNAVDGVSYVINENEIVGVVGESGCGKSVTQLSTLQLITSPPGKIVGGQVLFDGVDLLKFPANGDEMRSIRGGKIAMIFQEPMTSLNPVLTISQQLTEMVELHLKMNGHQSEKRAIELLEMVGIPDPGQRVNNYPHQFSGGMRQRAMIAMALSCNPRIVIADEPTTALDVTTQAQLLEMMKNMVVKFHTSLIIVTHNLGVVARYADRIYVMYAGKIVESGPSKQIFGNPQHPYTVGLLKSVPRLDEPRGRKLIPIYGMPPNLINMPDRCAFYPRCSYSSECKSEGYPDLRMVAEGHYVRCHTDFVREI
jgi:oligopeptide/dipeptide ABC transporter ATP-binding protein